MADNDVTPSCGNVFADLGLANAEALLADADARIAADCGCADGIVCRQNGNCPRLARAALLCPICGLAGCDSVICEPKRGRAEQQARAQVWAAREGVTGDAQ